MTRRDEADHDSLARELEHEADRMGQRSEELGEEVEEVRQDWRRKRADQRVPGAVPPAEATSAEGKDAPPEREASDARAEESG